MANLNRLVKDLKRDEGFRTAPYQCSAGTWTIGFGSTYIYGKPVTKNTIPITERFAEKLLFVGICEAWNRAKRFADNFDGLSDGKQEALINMCYQLGNRIFKFKKARIALNKGLWQEAFNEFRDSKWFLVDTPKRAKRVTLRFLT